MYDIFLKSNNLKDHLYASIISDKFSSDMLKNCAMESKTRLFYVAETITDEIINFKTNHDYIYVWDNAILYPKQSVLANTQDLFNNPTGRKIPVVNKSTKNLNYKPFDIFFISYKDPDADFKFQQLLKKYKTIKHLKDIKGIFNAHKVAAQTSSTHMFYVIDSDADILDSYSFDYIPLEQNFNKPHVWKSINPINNLMYGYGGIKLLPVSVFENDLISVDMTTSLNEIISMPTCSNYTNFNTDPYNTWRSAFRECAKLSSKIIINQNSKETEERLNVWCTVGKDAQNGEYCIKGALSGKKFGEENKENLYLINDFDWLYQRFKEES